VYGKTLYLIMPPAVMLTNKDQTHEDKGPSL